MIMMVINSYLNYGNKVGLDVYTQKNGVAPNLKSLFEDILN